MHARIPHLIFTAAMYGGPGVHESRFKGKESEAQGGKQLLEVISQGAAIAKVVLWG